MNRLLLVLSLFFSMALPGALTARATELPPDVLVRSKWMDLTRADYEAAIARVPQDKRYEFSTSPKRVQAMLNNLLVMKTLAAQARLDGVRPAGELGKPTEADPQRVLAMAELQRVEADAGKAFDARKDSFEAKAREIYKLDREKYRRPEEVRLSDIAVTIKDRGEDAARKRAEEARQRLMNGEDFAKVAREYSDDPTTRDKGGALPFVTRRELASDYAKAVFALGKVGEISAPIKAPAAYHVVRLEERHPARLSTFDEVRDSIMQVLRQRYIEEKRDERIASIHHDPDLQMNQAAIDALVNPVDPRQFKAAPPFATGTPAAK